VRRKKATPDWSDGIRVNPTRRFFSGSISMNRQPSAVCQFKAAASAQACGDEASEDSDSDNVRMNLYVL
jgi:hypothetical protein